MSAVGLREGYVYGIMVFGVGLGAYTMARTCTILEVIQRLRKIGVMPVIGDAIEYTFDGMSFEQESRGPCAWNPCVQIIEGNSVIDPVNQLLSMTEGTVDWSIGLVYDMPAP